MGEGGKEAVVSVDALVSILAKVNVEARVEKGSSSLSLGSPGKVGVSSQPIASLVEVVQPHVAPLSGGVSSNTLGLFVKEVSSCVVGLSSEVIPLPVVPSVMNEDVHLSEVSYSGDGSRTVEAHVEVLVPVVQVDDGQRPVVCSAPILSKEIVALDCPVEKKVLVKGNGG